tara:strand:- start:597 stop:767 length:171 start_codon:yes stop_codon:yes gene_type:complete
MKRINQINEQGLRCGYKEFFPLMKKNDVCWFAKNKIDLQSYIYYSNFIKIYGFATT